MLRGRFGNTSGRPFLEGRLILPNRNLSFEISFLVDTGADDTILMPADGIRVGLDYGQLGTAKTPKALVAIQPFTTNRLGWFSPNIENAYMSIS